MSESLLADWTEDDFDTLEEGVLVARHRLLESGLYSDESLAKLLDSHPEDCLSISTMGNDTTRFEWREGERNGVSGKDLLEIMKRGHLWINCRNILDHQPEYAAQIDSVYNELEQNNPRFKAENRSANLLISSPSALVHYHVDMPVNMLWHLRGVKRVWVYPHFDKRFASLPVIEKVCAGEWSEDVPYDESLDQYALVYDAQPGQLITWPQLAPHRVTNLEGLNVSLSTEHKNPRARRRLNVHQANHFLRNKLGMNPRSFSADGFKAHVKQCVARACRYAGKLSKKEVEHFTYPKSFIVDPQSELGYRLIEGKEDLIAAPHEENVSVVA